MRTARSVARKSFEYAVRSSSPACPRSCDVEAVSLEMGLCRRQHSLLLATTLRWQQTRVGLKSRLLSKTRPAAYRLRFGPLSDIPSCRFLPMADADKASSTELLKPEYSCQPSWPQLQKGYRSSANWRAARRRASCPRSQLQSTKGRSRRFRQHFRTCAEQGRRCAAGFPPPRFIIPSSCSQGLAETWCYRP